MSCAVDGRRNRWLLHERSSDSERYHGDHHRVLRGVSYRDCTKPTRCSNLEFVAEIVCSFTILASLKNQHLSRTKLRTRVYASLVLPSASYSRMLQAKQIRELYDLEDCRK
jgi:hypothetical protein